MEDDFGYEGRRRRRVELIERLRALPLVASAVFTAALLLLIFTTLHTPVNWNDATPWEPTPSTAPVAAPIDPDAPVAHTPAPRASGARATAGPSASTDPSATAAASAAPVRSPSPPAAPPAPRTVRYEAEGAHPSRARVASDHSGFSGSGFIDFENTTGSYLQWTVQASTGGQVTLRLRYANASGRNRPMDLAVNGATALRDVRFNPTRDWDDWGTTTVTVTLNAGANTVRATAVTGDGGPNVDYLEVTQ